MYLYLFPYLMLKINKNNPLDYAGKKKSHSAFVDAFLVSNYT